MLSILAVSIRHNPANRHRNLGCSMGSLLRCTTCIIPQGKGWLLFDSFSLFFLASILFLPVINLSSSLQPTKELMIFVSTPRVSRCLWHRTWSLDLRDEYIGYGYGLEMGPLTGYGYFLTTPLQNTLYPCPWLLGYLSSLLAVLVGAGIRYLGLWWVVDVCLFYVFFVRLLCL